MPQYDASKFYRLDISRRDGSDPTPDEIAQVLDGLTDAVYQPDSGIRETHCYVPRNQTNEAVKLLQDAGYDAD